MSHLLFVYGSLLLPGNKFADYLTSHSRYVTKGKIQGTLYDIGEYPGLIITKEIGSWVYGDVYEVDEQLLKLIDDYEGYGPNQVRPNLYIREIGAVETETGLIDAWIYVYNLPVTGLKKITPGNYLAYIEQKKSPGL